jgi:hypothetical protein
MKELAFGPDSPTVCCYTKINGSNTRAFLNELRGLNRLTYFSRPLF